MPEDSPREMTSPQPGPTPGVIISRGERTFIDELLAEQRQVTAVERFARVHDEGALPATAKLYRDLIPLTLPQPGQQYAFEVDLDRCSGCKACVSACHSLNGLDDDETWRDVGVLFSNDWRHPFQQTITTACHHCVDPGCLNGCPVLAYDKDPLTGIVRHLDDQCIGCQYCVMKCPYDVPKYSARRGIVRKCDMCHSRLAVGEAPACVQACPHEAIRITLVDSMTIGADFRGDMGPESVAFLPASPAPDITLPTTRYKSAKPLAVDLLAGDNASVVRADSHLPLVFMLVLTQLAVGMSAAVLFAESAKWLALAATGVAAVALGIASLHLGQPLKAWRAFLGWRKSWFSREVIAFGAFVPLAAVSAAVLWFAPFAPFQTPLAIATAGIGIVSVACSAMIYTDTRREFWRASQSFGKFFGTTLLLGIATLLAVSESQIEWWSSFVILVAAIKLAFEHRIFRELPDADALRLTSLNKTARLLDGELGIFTRTRIACGIVGGVMLPALLLLLGGGSAMAFTALAFCIAGEVLERYLFFTAVSPVKMPGGIGA